MKAILVDDEPLALRRLEKMLNKFDGIQVEGSYLFAKQALEPLEQIKPDVVFLDINMPGIDGLELAERVKEISSDMIIVFITAHDLHAVDAFDLEALDYLLKPISLPRLTKTVRRIQHKWQLLEKEKVRTTKPSVLTLHCLGSTRIEFPGRPPEPLKWRTTKAKEVFSYLFHRRGQLVDRDTLLDLFWTELEEHNAVVNLQTTIYRIRNLWKGIAQSLSHDEELVTITYASRGYRLELSDSIRIDTLEWEQRLLELDSISAENVAEHRKLVEEYEGHYLDTDYTWAEVERHRLKALWLREVRHLGEYYETRGSFMDALSIYYKALQLDLFNEESHFRLMKIYARLSDASAVRNQFARLQSMLSKELGVSPSDQVLAWYKEWLRDPKSTI